MITGVLKKVFGSKHERAAKSLVPLVAEINRFETEYQTLTDNQLRAKTPEFKERLQNGETTDDILPEAFAAVKNTCRRMVGTRVTRPPGTIEWIEIPYDVQLMGGIILHRGNIAEMQTGEGKTLVATMPLYLNALTGRNCQLVTVNDFLALRDSEWVGSVFRWLGLTVGCLKHDQNPEERRRHYGCDITYGTNSEFGFDYLRDMGMAVDPEDMVQRDYFYVIIDEVDSILIDEARTPLIISGPATVSSVQHYGKLKPTVQALFRKQYQLCTEWITDARKVLESDTGEVDAELTEEAMYKVLQVKLGMPKHKQLARVMETPAVRSGLDKLESQIRSDQNRGQFQEIKETLYFAIDERQHDADLSEIGRRTLRPDDSDAFLLPDLVAEFQEIDADEALSDATKLEKREQAQHFFDERSETIHSISQLLRAYCLYEKDVHYVVQENKVLIVDEFTGRVLPGRRFSEGLHQSLEAKEDVEIERETQTLATVTIQNYFRMYEKLAGMTGTADTEAQEFRDIYKLDVTVIPTNKRCVRSDNDDRIFKTRREKYNAIIDEVKECNSRGQPVLLGTVSVEVSEVLSRMLKRDKVTHNVLNAKHHESEAEIVERAGQRGSVTIATNMAGRGTDIRLGQGVGEVGGLHVIGSERHDARRIDRQLRGRCARQGDPGSSRFYISLEDNLMRLFASDRIARLMERFGFEEGDELSHPLLNKTVENAQRKVEQHHFSTRKRTLQFDDVMNKQREVIYGRRREVLINEDPRDMLYDFVEDAVYSHVEMCTISDQERHENNGSPLDSAPLLHWLNTTLPIGFKQSDVTVDPQTYNPETLVSNLMSRIKSAYETKEKGEDPESLRRLERYIMLNGPDKLWMEHLYVMEGLREGIYLRSFAQRDPLVEYKQEAFQIFGELMDRINDEIVGNMFRSATSLSAFQNFLASLPQEEVHQILGQFDVGQAPLQTTTGGNGETPPEPVRPKGVTYHRSQPKIGRNDPCSCGSGKKYKKCCGR